MNDQSSFVTLYCLHFRTHAGPSGYEIGVSLTLKPIRISGVASLTILSCYANFKST